MRVIVALAVLVSWPAQADTCVEHRAGPDVAFRPDDTLVPVEDPGQGRFGIDPEDIRIAIELPLRENDPPLDEGGTPTDIDATVKVGVIRIDDGRITFNGLPLSQGCQ